MRRGRANARKCAPVRAHDADVLAARRQFVVDAERFFHRERVGDVVRQRREIIQPVRVRDELGVSHVLGDFFVAAMQITHVRVGLGDDFAVQFQHDAQARRAWPDATAPCSAPSCRSAYPELKLLHRQR